MTSLTPIAGISLSRPDALYLLAIAGLVLVWSLVNAREWKRILAPIMRAIALALFIFALADPQTVMHFEGAARPAIIDASASITPAMRAWGVAAQQQLQLRRAIPR